MSHITFDIQLEEVMRDLSKVVQDDGIKGDMGLMESCSLYLRYIQIYKKLEDCYDQIIHAQKRIDLRRTLETCIGRILELKHWIVYLNKGSEFLDFYPILKDLDLGAEAVEVPHPRFMVDDNFATLQAQKQLLESTCVETNKQDLTSVNESTVSKEVAIGIIQACERGRQSRKRIAELFKIKKMQEEELHHKHSGGEALSPEAAARKIQALARGFLGRCRVKHSAEKELILIGMNELWHNPEREKVYEKMRENMQRRKSIQALNKLNYDEAFASAKEKLKELEGQEMREIIQEEINRWLLENRNPETGYYPTFPKPDEGGSKYILDPPPKMEFIEEGKKQDKKNEKSEKKTRPSVIKKVSLPAVEEGQTRCCPMFFRNHIIKSVQKYNNRWHDKDDSSNLPQKYDPDLLKSSLRPIIFEEVRLEVDQDTRVILNNIKKKMLAEAKALNKEKKKESKSSKKGEEETVKFTVLDMNTKQPKKPKDKTGQKSLEFLFNELAEKGTIQLCPNKSFGDYIGVDNLQTATIEGSTIIKSSMAQVRKAVMEYCVLPLASDFVHKNSPFVPSVLLYGGEANGKTLLVHAACSSAGATFINLSPRNLDGKYPGGQLKKMIQVAFKVAKIMAPSIIYIDEVEMAMSSGRFATNIHNLHKEDCVLYGSQNANQAVADQLKELINAGLLFVRDKKKFKASGLKDKPSRLKSPIIKEVSSLQPGDRVLIVGTSSNPQFSPLKPPSLFSLFPKRIYVPYPDYTSRVLLWRAMLERNGAVLELNFNLSILAHLSMDYSPGIIEEVCKSVLTKKRLRKLHSNPLIPEELIVRLWEFLPLDKAMHEILQNWEDQEPKPVDDAKDSKGKPKKK